MARRKGNHFYVAGLKKPLKWNPHTREAIWKDLQPVIRRQRQHQRLTLSADDLQVNIDNGNDAELLNDNMALDSDIPAIDSENTLTNPVFSLQSSRHNKENRKRRDANWIKIREPFLEAILSGKKACCRTPNCESTSHIIWLVSLSSRSNLKHYRSLQLIS